VDAGFPKQLTQDLIATRAINRAPDPFARGAYSYVTPETPKAQSALASPEGVNRCGIPTRIGELSY
jgi:hypothetical protein